jgi:hypothetical protein
MSIRLWDCARKIAPHHLRFFFKKPNPTGSSSRFAALGRVLI